jgi:hypothetical protein
MVLFADKAKQVMSSTFLLALLPLNSGMALNVELDGCFFLAVFAMTYIVISTYISSVLRTITPCPSTAALVGVLGCKRLTVGRLGCVVTKWKFARDFVVICGGLLKIFACVQYVEFQICIMYLLLACCDSSLPLSN